MLCALIVNWGAYMVGYRTVLLLLPLVLSVQTLTLTHTQVCVLRYNIPNQVVVYFIFYDKTCRLNLLIVEC